MAYEAAKVPLVIGLITHNDNDNDKHPTKSSTITILKDRILWDKDDICFTI